MKSKMEIRQHALRAAAKVALLGALACGGTEDATILEAPELPEGLEPALALPEVTPQVHEFTVAPTECVSPGAEGDWEAYVACCEAIGWDWERGCAAWGPPVPPTMEVA